MIWAERLLVPGTEPAELDRTGCELAYLEAGEPADMVFDPPLHVIREGRATLMVTVTFDRGAYVRFLPLAL